MLIEWTVLRVDYALTYGCCVIFSRIVQETCVRFILVFILEKIRHQVKLANRFWLYILSFISFIVYEVLWSMNCVVLWYVSAPWQTVLSLWTKEDKWKEQKNCFRFSRFFCFSDIYYYCMYTMRSGSTHADF